MKIEGFGQRGAVACAMAVAAAFALPAVDASEFSEPIGTKISLVKPGKLYKIVSKPAVAYPIPAIGAGDPLALGGSIIVWLNGQVLTCNLTAGLWKGLSNPPGSKGWKYVNTEAPAGDPCRLVLVKPGVIKVLAKATGPLVVNGPGANSDVSLRIRAGIRTYCARATPPFLVEKPGTLLKAKGAPPPAACAGNGLPPTTYYTFTTGLPTGGTSGTLSNYRCSNYASGACAEDGDCDFGTCLDPPGICADRSDATCSGNGTPCTGTCGEVSSGSLPFDLTVASLYAFGGLNSVPLPLPVPDRGRSVMTLAADGTLGPTPPAAVGERHCTQGRTCSITTSQVCVVDGDCPGGETCLNNCLYAAPLPIPNPMVPFTSVCAVNVVGEDVAGTLDCDTGALDADVPLRSVLYVNGDLFRASTPPDIPGVQPCPLCSKVCVGGGNAGFPCVDDSDCNSNNCTESEQCLGGLNDGLPCMSQTSRLDVHTCCSNGPNETHRCDTDADCGSGAPRCEFSFDPCMEDSDCIAIPYDHCIRCRPGCTSYPTSHDCPPDPSQDITANIRGLPITLATTTGTQELNAVDLTTLTPPLSYGKRVFCGYCRDVASAGAGGSLCFEGSTKVGCPAAIPAADGNGVPCLSDADCAGDDADEYESCVQRNPGAFFEAAATRISVTGATEANICDGAVHSQTQVSIFCIPPTFDSTVDAVFDLPGPGAVLLLGEAQVVE